ncbi:MAG: hypothetical protein ACLVK8_02805 [Ruminococcus sp.]
MNNRDQNSHGGTGTTPGISPRTRCGKDRASLAAKEASEFIPKRRKHFPALFRTGVPQRIRQFRRRAQPLRKSPADPGCRFFLTPQRTPDATQPLRTAPEQRIP